MKTLRPVWYAFALLFALALPILPAHAQATRTWVSGVGDDANPCSRTAPCKTFAGAISKTAAGGEINTLDPGGFGTSLTINKSITIISQGFEAGMLPSAGANAIVVNMPNATDRAILEGLDLEGSGTAQDGVRIVGSGSTIIRRSSIRNFTGNGVNLVGANGARAFLQDLVISHSGGGANVQGNAANVANALVVDNTTFDTLTNFAIKVSSAGDAFVMGSRMIGPGGPKLVIDPGGSIVSALDNVVRGTTADFTSTFAKQ